LDLAGEKPVIIRRLIVSLTFAAVAFHAGLALAQSALPAPWPGQGAASDACMNGFAPLRAEAEARGRLIKAASERHAPPAEACKLIGNFRQSEIKMIKYVEANLATCGIAPELAEQLRARHQRTGAMLKTVCAAARPGEPAGRGPVGDFDDIDAGKL
jgi:hypothetical protein